MSEELSNQSVRKFTPIQLMVDRWARKRRGFTTLELESAMGDHGSTYRTRVSELRRLGFIRPAGYSVKREGEHRGRNVWIHTRKPRPE